jgi:hypothetical protein
MVPCDLETHAVLRYAKRVLCVSASLPHAWQLKIFRSVFVVPTMLTPHNSAHSSGYSYSADATDVADKQLSRTAIAYSCQRLHPPFVLLLRYRQHCPHHF